MLFKKKKESKGNEVSVKVAKSMLKKVDDFDEEEYTKLSRVSAGTVLALGMPAVFTGTVAAVGVEAVGEIVDTIGGIAGLPTGLLAQSFLNAASETDSKVAKATLYTVGAVAAVPTLAIALATGVTSGIIKLGASVLSLATYAVATPFFLGAKGVLKLGKKKKSTSDVIEIEPEDIDLENN